MVGRDSESGGVSKEEKLERKFERGVEMWGLGWVGWVVMEGVWRGGLGAGREWYFSLFFSLFDWARVGVRVMGVRVTGTRERALPTLGIRREVQDYVY